MNRPLFARKGYAAPSSLGGEGIDYERFRARRMITMASSVEALHEPVPRTVPVPSARPVPRPVHTPVHTPVNEPVGALVEAPTFLPAFLTGFTQPEHEDKGPIRKFSLRLTEDLHRQMHAAMDDTNTSGQKLLTRLLRNYLVENGYRSQESDDEAT